MLTVRVVSKGSLSLSSFDENNIKADIRKATMRNAKKKQNPFEVWRGAQCGSESPG